MITDCPTCHGYGTHDGKPAPTSTYAALLVDDEGCVDCGGTGEDADEVRAGHLADRVREMLVARDAADAQRAAK